MRRESQDVRLIVAVPSAEAIVPVLGSSLCALLLLSEMLHVSSHTSARVSKCVRGKTLLISLSFVLFGSRKMLKKKETILSTLLI